MLNSKIYLKSKHRLGRSPRVKIEDENLKIAGVLELADKQASDTCVFNMRVQVPSPAPKRRWKMIRCPSSFLSIAKAMVYLLFVGRTRRMTQDTASGMHHALACISSPQAYIIRFDEHISPKRVYHQPQAAYSFALHVC